MSGFLTPADEEQLRRFAKEHPSSQTARVVRTIEDLRLQVVRLTERDAQRVALVDALRDIDRILLNTDGKWRDDRS